MVDAPIHPTGDKSGGLKHPQVLRNRGEGHCKWLCKLADTCRLFLKALEDGSPRLVGKSVEYLIQSIFWSELFCGTGPGALGLA
jgi:hypothetical protein